MNEPNHCLKAQKLAYKTPEAIHFNWNVDVKNTLIELGSIKSAHGIKGWLNVHSFTRPIEQIFDYEHWRIGKTNKIDVVTVQHGNKSPSGKLIVKLIGCDDRNSAELLVGSGIFIDQQDMEALSENEYYWRELIGLTVVNTQDVQLGIIKEILETGANDVFVVELGDIQRLIPYSKSIIDSVDLEQNTIVLDWHEDY